MLPETRHSDISENIQVTSIVGRFLEHSRIYYFRNGGNEEIYLGSADLMPRNIDRRVEVLFPVQDRQMITHIIENILSNYAKDNIKARKMMPDGTYVRITPKENETPLNIQNWFISTRR
jgi:polyphosphate kinase